MKRASESMKPRRLGLLRLWFTGLWRYKFLFLGLFVIFLPVTLFLVVIADQPPQALSPDPGSPSATAPQDSSIPLLVVVGSIATGVSALITSIAALLNAVTARQTAQRATASPTTSTTPTVQTLWVPNTLAPKRKRSRWRRS
jgi:hypothetical protein